MTSQKAGRHISNCSQVLLVDNQQVGAHVGALGVCLVPGGQQVDVTDQPVAAAREAQPAVGADGWRQDEVRGRSDDSDNNKKLSAVFAVSERRSRIFCAGNIPLTAQRPLAHVGTLVFARVKSPFAVLLRPVFNEGGTHTELGVPVGKTRACKLWIFIFRSEIFPQESFPHEDSSINQQGAANTGNSQTERQEAAGSPAAAERFRSELYDTFTLT